jgi:hypothetical protein
MVGDQILNDKKFKQKKDKVIEPSEENPSLEKDDGKSSIILPIPLYLADNYQFN